MNAKIGFVVAAAAALLGILIGLFGVNEILIGHFLHGSSSNPKASPTAHFSSSPSTKPQIGLPKTLSIPKIGVNATVEEVGLDSQNRMDVPSNSQNVAWYKYGARPGEAGSSVIDGHLDTVTGAQAVFYDLKLLSPGDEISVTDTNNKTYNFKVTQNVSYPFDQLPMQQIFAAPGEAKLNLITCEGTWNSVTHNYSNRVVVYSKLSQ